MKPSIALLAALLLAACACTRGEHGAPPVAMAAESIDPGPAIPPVPAPSVAEPEPPPTPEEVAAFHAPVPK